MSYTNFHRPRTPGLLRYFMDLLRFRHLCWNLVGSDLRARFRRSKLGVLWAIIQPLGYSLIIAWAWASVFDSESYIEFGIYVFSGMLVWECFSNTISSSQDALLASVGYLRQARVPFFIFQIRVPLTLAVIFSFGVLGLVGLLAATQQLPPLGPHLLLLPAFVLLLVAFMTPLAVIFSVLGVQLRDLKHIMSLAVQALFFLSPVMLARDVLDAPHLTFLQYLNPMTPMIGLFRDPVLYGQLWDRTELTTVAIWGAALWVMAFVVSIKAGRKIVFHL
jgi:lipopolysaccharide transport system permease protein